MGLFNKLKKKEENIGPIVYNTDDLQELEK